MLKNTVKKAFCRKAGEKYHNAFGVSRQIPASPVMRNNISKRLKTTGSRRGGSGASAQIDGNSGVKPIKLKAWWNSINITVAGDFPNLVYRFGRTSAYVFRNISHLCTITGRLVSKGRSRNRFAPPHQVATTPSHANRQLDDYSNPDPNSQAKE